jgi:hypothetical protein
MADDNSESSPRPFSVSSYAHLLREVPVPPGNRGTGARAAGPRSPNTRRDPGKATAAIDAIVIPTVRRPEQLRYAVGLAKEARCRLLILYTGDAPAGLPSVLAELEPGMATVLSLGLDVRHDLLDLAAGLRQGPVSSCALDISRKRNLGLLIGRMCGWTRMLFLDDDIRRLSITRLRSASALLRKYPVVGLQVIKYPDASAVGHARRLGGYRQEPFISGGSLLVDPQRMDGFFPATYHEDWLCVINHLRRGEVAVGGTVGQLPYRPFTTTERAKLEEFGDVLAFGLLWLVHDRHAKSALGSTDDDVYWRRAVRAGFWEEVLDQRGVLLGKIAGSIQGIVQDNPAPGESVAAARKRLAELTPGEFTAFVTSWLNALGAWRRRVGDLPRAGSVTEALARLGLADAVPAHPLHPLSPRPAAGLPVSQPQPREGYRRFVPRLRASAGDDRFFRHAAVERLRGAQRPPAGRDQAQDRDKPAAAGHEYPSVVASMHELGPEWTAVQAPGQDRAGDGHAECLADLPAG